MRKQLISIMAFLLLSVGIVLAGEDQALITKFVGTRKGRIPVESKGAKSDCRDVKLIVSKEGNTELLLGSVSGTPIPYRKVNNGRFEVGEDNLPNLVFDKAGRFFVTPDGVVHMKGTEAGGFSFKECILK